MTDDIDEWYGDDSGGSFPAPHVLRTGREVEWWIEGEHEAATYATTAEARAAFDREVDEYETRAREE